MHNTSFSTCFGASSLLLMHLVLLTAFPLHSVWLHWPLVFLEWAFWRGKGNLKGKSCSSLACMVRVLSLYHLGCSQGKEGTLWTFVHLSDSLRKFLPWATEIAFYLLFPSPFTGGLSRDWFLGTPPPSFWGSLQPVPTRSRCWGWEGVVWLQQYL